MNILRQNVFKNIALMFVVMFIVVSIFVSLGTQKVHANPLYFSLSAGTSAATTTLNYMTQGAATTTETWITTDVSNQALFSAVLLLNVKSSTTVSTTFGTTTLSLRIEQSMDGIDWAFSTSSTLQTSSTEQSGSALIASTSVATKIITGIPTTSKYVRAIIGVQPGSSNNAGVRAQFVGQREIK